MTDPLLHHAEQHRRDAEAFERAAQAETPVPRVVQLPPGGRWPRKAVAA